MAQENVVEALVLRRWEVGEADKRLCLFTRELGKVYALARGSRRVASKMASMTEPLCRIQTRLIEGRVNLIVAQPQPLGTLSGIHFDMERLGCALAFCEVLDRSLPEGQPHEELFDMSCRLLTGLESHPEPRTLLAWNLWKLMAMQGYFPQLSECVFCNAGLSGQLVALGANQGGYVCPRCLSKAPDAYRLTTLAMMELQSWFSNSEPPSQSDFSNELMHAARVYAQFHLEAPLRSFDFLNMLNLPLNNG